MLSKIKLSLSLLDRKSRIIVASIAIIRILISALDTVGIIFVGLLVAKSTNQFIGNATSGSVTFIDVNNFLNSLSLTQIAVTATGLLLLKSLLAVYFTRKLAVTLAGAETKIASDSFNKLLKADYRNFAEQSNQDIIFTLTISITFAITNLITTAVTILSESALLITITVLFFFVDATVAAGIVIYLSVIGLLIYLILGPKMQRAGVTFSESTKDSGSALHDALVSYRELVTLRKQDEFVQKFKKGRIGVAKFITDINFYSALPRYIVESAIMVGAVILALVIFSNNDAPNALGILGIFLTGSVRVMASMLPLQSSFSTIRQLIGQSEPFFGFIEKLSKSESSFSQKLIENDKPTNPLGVKFRNVSFSYPNSTEFAVKDISFEIKPGDYIALLGPSGSGKSTIADLIIGILKPDSGIVSYVNGDIREAQIGYVPQSSGIVSGTILDNITLNVTSGKFDQQKLERALSGSHLTDLISSLENGVNTDLGAQTNTLSGGQMQRIGLARALYSIPDILVLDEATSALDAETEFAITESLHKLKKNCTIIVIAHRLSSIQDADCVFVIDNGKIVASGKFDELAKSNDLVARYIELSEIRKS